MNDIQSRIVEVIENSKNLPHGSVNPETTFEQLQIDSLDKINLSFDIEEMFSIQIPDENLNSLHTVGDIVRGVEQLLAAQKRPATT